MFKELNYLLTDITDQELFGLQGRHVMLTAGTRLQESGTCVDFVYFPRSCVVSLAVVMPDGRSAETATVGREGATGIFAGIGPCSSPARADTRATVIVGGAALRVPVARLAALVQRAGGFCDAVAAYQRSLMRQITHTAACNVLHPLEQRLSRWLLVVDRRGDGQHIRVTQEGLAQILAVHRASLHKTVQKLVGNGAISVLRRGRIEIGDRAILTASSCQCSSLL